MENISLTFIYIESEESKLTQTTRLGLAALCLLSLFCGLAMKSIVFWHFSQTKIWTKPINVLILADELIFVISGSYILLQMSTWLLSNSQTLAIFENMPRFQSPCYCSVYISITSFHYFYGTFGSFGISLHRYVLILKPHWVKRLTHEKIMLIIILGLCLSANIGLVFLYNSGNVTRRNAYNTCMGRTETFQVILVSISFLNPSIVLTVQYLKYHVVLFSAAI